MNASLDAALLLSLADGSQVVVWPCDEQAARVVSYLGEVACLSPAPRKLPPCVRCLRVTVRTDSHGRGAEYGGDDEPTCVLDPIDTQLVRRRFRRPDGETRCVFESPTPERWLWVQLVRLSAAIGREAQRGGGVLIHSALAHLPSPHRRGTEGEGILLAGPSGAGKTTASLRLPPPWQSLADDVTLVVRDPAGEYWAHPWPTWSRLLGQDVRHSDGRWEVQRAVPLRALFFLEQAKGDRVEAIGAGHAVCRLAVLAEQASRDGLSGCPPAEIAAENRRRFENLCALARAMPSYVLHISVGGAFWQPIEQALSLQRGE